LARREAARLDVVREVGESPGWVVVRRVEIVKVEARRTEVRRIEVRRVEVRRIEVSCQLPPALHDQR